MPPLDRDLDRDRDRNLLLGLLTRQGIASSRELQAALGKSQATVSRLLSALPDRVVRLGRARGTGYALLQPIHGLPGRQPIFWTDEHGTTQPLGMLSLLAGARVHVESDHVKAPPSAALPWFLAPLKAQGFLGRVHAQRLGDPGLQGDPDRWDLEATIYSALHLQDAPGAVTLGELQVQRAGGAGHAPLPATSPTDTPTLGKALDAQALDVARTLPAGSSAGGEQPKLLALQASGEHVLVKFSPPRGTPFGERWHDLLHAECLASQVLRAHGVVVADARVVETAQRTYLVSERFDRIGASGRRHVVSIGEAHGAFVADRYSHWAVTADELARQGRLSHLHARQIAALFAFGRLIGNSDMHAGNLGLFVTLAGLAKGRFSLAPVYDMLPMRWRPDAALGGAPEYAAFEPDAASLRSAAAAPARDFWARLEAQAGVDVKLRQVAGAMVRRLA